jgi:hypothetical protein
MEDEDLKKLLVLLQQTHAEAQASVLECMALPVHSSAGQVICKPVDSRDVSGVKLETIMEEMPKTVGDMQKLTDVETFEECFQQQKDYSAKRKRKGKGRIQAVL